MCVLQMLSWKDPRHDAQAVAASTWRSIYKSSCVLRPIEDGF